MIRRTPGASGVAAMARPPMAAVRLLILAVALLVASAVQPPTGQAMANQQQAGPTTTTPPAAAAPGPVVASAERGDLPGITLTVDQLRRSDPNTVTVVFTIANKDGEPPVFDWTWGELGLTEVGNAFAFDMSGIYLVEGKKKYLVLRDTNNRCICSTGVYRSGTPEGLTPGTAATMFAKFPAPPASVTRVAVVVPHFPVLDGLPLAS
jgi:hypothetical protein